MSIESDAHSSYLVKWVFDMVARISPRVTSDPDLMVK